MNNINTIIEKLKASPLFYLFLSSRELFHSNFWFWLSTLNKIETLKLFSDEPITTHIEFKREHKQKYGEFKSTVDLYVKDYMVIENKVKDFPTLSQLNRIKDSFGITDIKFILTTLFSTNDLTFEGWTIKTYRAISESIEPQKFTHNTYYQSLISDYKQFVLNLSQLSEQLEIKQEYNFAISSNKILFEALNKVKLWEGYQKLRASHLLIHFSKNNVHNVTTSYGIHNQKATIDFFIDLEYGYKLGIQIEDIQYRKYVIGSNAEDFAENLIRQNVFLSNKFLGRGGKPYLNYGLSFKYQYEKFEKTTFNVIFERINNDFQNILGQIENIKKQIPRS